MRRKFIFLLLIISTISTSTGCALTKDLENSASSQLSENIEGVDTSIELGEEIKINGEGVTLEGNKIIISKAGSYSISGTLDNGQLVVNAGDEENVNIILNGANITCSSSAPIYVLNSKNTIVTLADNTENIITDGEEYVIEDLATNEPNATIFSKDDIKFTGNGKLIVNANYNNGITSKDDLEIISGNITVNSVADGIKGKDSVSIVNGEITINAIKDGIQSSNAEEVEKGYVSIEGGTINIISGQDGIQAETNALISGGNIKITSGGGSLNSTSKSEEKFVNPGQIQGGMMGENPGEIPGGIPIGEPSEISDSELDESSSVSAKGIKATVNVTIEGGNIEIDSADDSIHSNDSLIVNGGIINIESGDDGIHSDSTLDINNGEINIKKSYEGIESEVITINNGNINVISTDDGINAGGGNDGSSLGGRPGQNNFNVTGNSLININGGNISIDASGDGVDSNGSIYMTDGVVIVNGPENNGNGALDYDGNFDVSGGVIIAAGSSGMTQSVSQSSTQNAVNITLRSQIANTMLHIEDENGEEVITFAPSKAYESIVVSLPSLKNGSTYKVYNGGSSTGNNVNGLYSEGEYSGGSEIASFTISSIITNVSQEGANVGGMGGNRVGRP